MANSFFNLPNVMLHSDVRFARKYPGRLSLDEIQQGGRRVQFMPWMNVIREGTDNASASFEFMRIVTDEDARENHALRVVKKWTTAKKLRLDMKVHRFIMFKQWAGDKKLGYAFLIEGMCLRWEDMLTLDMPLAMANLRDYLRRVDGGYRDRARKIVAQIALAITTLHSIGIVHGNLKPENVLIDFKENVKVADFGSCIMIMPLKPLTDMNFAVPVDKPECNEFLPYSDSFLDNSVGIASDYWALGCIAYELEVAMQNELTEEQRCNNVLVNTSNMGMWLAKRDLALRVETERDALMRILPDVGKNLNEDSLSLIAGLVSPFRFCRFSIEELLIHSYFFKDGSTKSEFEMLKDDLERPDLRDPRNQDVRYHDAEPLPGRYVLCSPYEA